MNRELNRLPAQPAVKTRFSELGADQQRAQGFDHGPPLLQPTHGLPRDGAARRTSITLCSSKQHRSPGLRGVSKKEPQIEPNDRNNASPIEHGSINSVMRLVFNDNRHDPICPSNAVMPGPSLHPDPVELLRHRSRLARRAGLVWLACACAAGTLPGLPVRAQPSPASSPSFYDNFAGMALLDQAGQPLQLNRLQGQVVLFNFIFTACATVCPVQTQALAQMLRRMKPALRARVRLVSVSLDPLSDTPRTLSEFARRHQVDTTGWSLVTGRPGDIQRLAEALWLFRDGRGKGPLEEHATSVWLVDPQGALRLRLAGQPIDTNRLERELAALAGPSS